jgi:hypothetical protein
MTDRNLDRLALPLDDLFDLTLEFRVAIVQRPSARAHLLFVHARNYTAKLGPGGEIRTLVVLLPEQVPQPS